MRVHTAKPAETVGGHTGTSEIGHFDLFCVADHNVIDLSFSVYQHADLASGLVRKFGHLPRKFGRNYLVWWYPPRTKPLNSAKLIVFKPFCKAVYITNKALILR